MPGKQPRRTREAVDVEQWRRAGKTPRSSNDCLIARIAIEHDLLLLHDDRDFEAIASVETALRIYDADA